VDQIGEVGEAAHEKAEVGIFEGEERPEGLPEIKRYSEFRSV
jgi:hypothetical protein